MAFHLPTSPSSSSLSSSDFRGVHTDYKRNKDISLKWAHGMRPSKNPAAAPDKLRPTRSSGLVAGSPCIDHHKNVVKFSRGHKPWMPAGRVRAQADAMMEIADVRRHGLSNSLDLGTAAAVKPQDTSSSSSPHILYSYDNTDSPPPALTLDLFVKPATARATEKLVERLVEKEYEVLDDNGDAVRGRKARQMLRNRGPPAASTAEAEIIIVDDGFELV